MRIIVNALGKVLMYSAAGQPTPDAGQTAIDLSTDQAATFATFLSQPNGGISFDGQNFTSVPFVADVPIDLSNLASLPKYLQALGVMIANFTGKTPAQVATAYNNAWNSLP